MRWIAGVAALSSALLLAALWLLPDERRQRWEEPLVAGLGLSAFCALALIVVVASAQLIAGAHRQPLTVF